MDQQKKILIVEDEQLIRDLYVRELTKAGFLITAAGTAEEGLIELTKQMYDMLLLDIMLPGMNGLEMLKEYKIRNPQSTMIVVLLTNLGQDSIIKEGFELGAQGYLIKGAYTPAQIIQEVRSAFGNKANPAVTPAMSSDTNISQPAPVDPNQQPAAPAPMPTATTPADPTNTQGDPTQGGGTPPQTPPTI